MTHVSITVPRNAGLHFAGRPLGLVLLVLYKGLWGTLEVGAGVLVLFSYRIFSGELIEDPQDMFVNWLFAHIGVTQALHIGTVIILLGIIKIMIALGVWYRSWAMRNAALVFFGAAGAFGAYELSVHLTMFRASALLVDLFLLWYFWIVLPKHLHDRLIC